MLAVRDGSARQCRPMLARRWIGAVGRTGWRKGLPPQGWLGGAAGDMRQKGRRRAMPPQVGWTVDWRRGANWVA